MLIRSVFAVRQHSEQQHCWRKSSDCIGSFVLVHDHRSCTEVSRRSRVFEGIGLAVSGGNLLAPLSSCCAASVVVRWRGGTISRNDVKGLECPVFWFSPSGSMSSSRSAGMFLECLRKWEVLVEHRAKIIEIRIQPVLLRKKIVVRLRLYRSSSSLVEMI